jgi:NAD(P)-dependent dehydrogenase (short-subunit alcohol dehydrogenase family)
MDLQLGGKLALVSGSTKGIGLAIATVLAREGAEVIVNGRSEASLAQALERISESVTRPKLLAFAGDLSDAGTAEALVKRFPDIDILVNNLGIFEPKPFDEIPDDDWRRFFELNVLSGVRLSRAYLAGMKRHGWGRIVFISSETPPLLAA